MDHDSQGVVENQVFDAALGEGVLMDNGDHRGEGHLRKISAIIESEGGDAADEAVVYGCGNDDLSPNLILVF